MATGSNGSGSTATPAYTVLVRVALYYALLIVIGALAYRYVPRTRMIADGSLEALFGPATETISGFGKKAQVIAPDQGTLAATVAVAMLFAALVSLPIAWIYTLTRSRRGYQQSVVQLLVVLPVVVAGIVVMVKYSITLAFSLGGIAAAVRFRNSLDDSKDAVYVFLVTGIGIAAAVDLPVALVISMVFNALIIALWVSDFGRTPVALEGKLAERRLQRARALARTGTFVARIDDEVFANMSAEQLEGLAQRALRRATQNNSDGVGRSERVESTLRVQVRDAALVRAVIEARLEESAKRWSVGSATTMDDGTTTIDYVVLPKKRTTPDQLVSLVRAAAGTSLVNAELR